MKTYKVTINDEGTISWYNEKGQLHREDGPAFEYSNGDKYWYQNHQLHRLDGPAVEYESGTRCWYRNGQLHREDGPAIEYFDGDVEWHIEGVKLTEQTFSKRAQSLCEGKLVEIEGRKYRLSAI